MLVSVASVCVQIVWSGMNFRFHFEVRARDAEFLIVVRAQSLKKKSLSTRFSRISALPIDTSDKVIDLSAWKNLRTPSLFSGNCSNVSC